MKALTQQLTNKEKHMSEHFSRRELVTGAAALMLADRLVAADPVADKKQYQVYMADKQVVEVKISVNPTARAIVATANGNVRLNIDDTLVVDAGGQPFTMVLFPMNGGPPHPFLKWSGNVVDGVATFKGTRLEAVVKEFTTLPLPIYQYNVVTGGQVLDPWIIIDGRVANPWICVGGRCT
jgi:hypothetical protein